MKRLDRHTYATSRLLDIFSEKKLTARIGHAKAEWPLLKQAVNNLADAGGHDGELAPIIRH
jgi:hypothetical protein